VTDIVARSVRSRIMRSIRGRDTQPELLLRRALHARGFRYRLHRRIADTRPDLVLPRWRAVIMVHGCFWHRHPGCKFAYTPRSRTRFWREKFRENVARDERDLARLRAAGWRVLIVWECGLRDRRLRESVLEQAAKWLRSRSTRMELPGRAASEKRATRMSNTSRDP